MIIRFLAQALTDTHVERTHFDGKSLVLDEHKVLPRPAKQDGAEERVL